MAAIAGRSFSFTLHCREKPQTELPASCTVLLLSESTLIKEVLESYFNLWTETGQSNWSCTDISLVKFLLTNQSGPVTTNQDTRFQPIRRVLFGPIKLQIWIPYLHKNEPIRDQGRRFLCIRGVHV